MADYRPTRRQREQKAYNSLVVGGVSGVGALVAFIAGAGFVGFLLLVVAVVAGLMFRRSVS